MFRSRRTFRPLADRGPLRVMFLLTSMPVGGAETLLVNLVRRLDRERFAPEIVCLKDRGPLGEELAAEMPVHANLLRHKYDLAVLGRLRRLFVERRIDAVVTVGCGDKMFWGRLAAWQARTPVILAALHSTGWPDGVGRLNRLLTPLTDGFIGVAEAHGRFLVEHERFPEHKVFVIPNGIDVERFQPSPAARGAIRAELGVAGAAPVVGIVAALRPEKNHELFLTVASRIATELPDARFVVVGDGPERPRLEQLARLLRLDGKALFVGTRPDIPQLLAACDLFALTSHNEANPVSILEALAVETPVVATRVGSVAEMVVDEETGLTVPPADADAMTAAWRRLLSDADLRRRWGAQGRRRVVERASLDVMVGGYERLIEALYVAQAGAGASPELAVEPSLPVCSGLATGRGGIMETDDVSNSS